MGAALLCGQLFAGGIVTNSNQSAQYVRMMSRNASYGIDAVYFNPAGIAMLDNGFHLSFNNQSIFQSKTITTTFPMNNSEFIGDVKAPLFPSFFAAYKKDKIGISFGFGPNGGGGSAEFENGLPSFEMLVASGNLPGALTASGIPTSAYDADIYFSGSSIYWGSQLNFTYAVNDQLSLAAGIRMINAKNTYEGYLKTSINPTFPALGLDGSTMVSAPQFFTDMSSYLLAASQQAYGAAAGVQPLIDAGVPDLETALALGVIDNATYDQLTGGLGDNYINGMPIGTVQATYNTIGATAEGTAPVMAAYADATSDIEVDATQTGMAITPILSAQYAPNEKLNIAVKYELNTGLELTNDTKVDGSGMFKHDSTFRSDIPAILGLGVGYKLSDKFRTQFSFTSYIDKGADWGGREDDVDNNMWEAAIGFEYDLSDKLTASLGYSRGTTGVGKAYQTDISYSNSSNTVGLGIQFKPMENLTIDIGGLMVMYEDYKVDYPIDMTPIYSTTYAKSTSMFAFGVSYSF